MVMRLYSYGIVQARHCAPTGWRRSWEGGESGQYPAALGALFGEAAHRVGEMLPGRARWVLARYQGAQVMLLVDEVELGAYLK